MIIVGLLAHGKPPSTIPKLESNARVVVAVNAKTSSAPTPWRGFGANHNRLMDEYGEAEWYVALNPDVEISSEQLHMLIDQAETHGYALAAPIRRDPWGIQGRPSTALPDPSHFLKAAFRTGRFERHRRTPSKSVGPMVDSAWVAGCCMAIRGDLARELRFDERFFMYFEDVDICQRAWRMGARVGVCSAVTINHGSGWRHDDPLIANRGVEYARSVRLYAEVYGHSPRRMKMAVLAWALPRTVFPGRSANELAASKAISGGIALTRRTGISELASSHNNRYGFHVD